MPYHPLAHLSQLAEPSHRRFDVSRTSSPSGRPYGSFSARYSPALRFSSRNVPNEVAFPPPDYWSMNDGGQPFASQAHPSHYPHPDSSPATSHAYPQVPYAPQQSYYYSQTSTQYSLDLPVGARVLPTYFSSSASVVPTSLLPVTPPSPVSSEYVSAESANTLEGQHDNSYPFSAVRSNSMPRTATVDQEEPINEYFSFSASLSPRQYPHPDSPSLSASNSGEPSPVDEDRQPESARSPTPQPAPEPEIVPPPRSSLNSFWTATGARRTRSAANYQQAQTSAVRQRAEEDEKEDPPSEPKGKKARVTLHVASAPPVALKVEEGGGTSRKRKGKAPSSCAECRRLKMKCNLKEQQPCSSCVARGCAVVCPHGELANLPGKRLVLADTETLHARIASLEAALAVSYAREDPSYLSATTAGPKIHPLLKPEFVDYEGSKDSNK